MSRMRVAFLSIKVVFYYYHLYIVCEHPCFQYELEENSTKLVEGENKKRTALYLEINDVGGCEVELQLK